MRNTELGQLPVEPRDLVIPLLKSCLRPLERGVLLLKPTLRLFPRQAFPLEGSPGLDEGSLLLLELVLCLLACGPLLPELLLRRRKRRGLLSHARPQLFTSLAFPSAWRCKARAPSRVAQSC
jgi:hypothetical protein